MEELCDVRFNWMFDIEQIEESLLEPQSPSTIQYKIDRLNHLKEMNETLDAYISDLSSKIEVVLEDISCDIAAAIESYNEWGKADFQYNKELPILKECADDIYPLILQAKSINAQKRGLSGIIKKLSKFALDLQNTIDAFNGELSNAETIPDFEEITSKYTDESPKFDINTLEDKDSKVELVIEFTCPVCLRKIEINTERCPYCNYTKANKSYRNDEERELWLKKVVLPLRNRYIEQLELKAEQLKSSEQESNLALYRELAAYLTFLKEETLIENILKIEYVVNFGRPPRKNNRTYSFYFDKEELVVEYTQTLSTGSELSRESGVYDTSGIRSKDFLRKIVNEEKIYQIDILEDCYSMLGGPYWYLSSSGRCVMPAGFKIGYAGDCMSHIPDKLCQTSLGMFIGKKPSGIKDKR